MVPGMPDYTVPASAQELYSVALHLVASSVHDPQHPHKFWVVHVGQDVERRTVPAQLRGCKTLNLPRDVEKLHPKDKKCWRLSCRMWCSPKAKKARQALLQMGQEPTELPREY